VGPGPGFGWAVQGRAASPVVAGAGTTERVACPFAGDAAFDELVDTGVEDGVQVSSGVALFEMSSKSA